MTPRELSKVLAQQAGTVGTVFGREGTGLNNHELSLCDAIVTIPASKAYQTLNLSHAAAIIFYELFKLRIKGRRRGVGYRACQGYDSQIFVLFDDASWS